MDRESGGYEIKLSAADKERMRNDIETLDGQLDLVRELSEVWNTLDEEEQVASVRALGEHFADSPLLKMETYEDITLAFSVAKAEGREEFTQSDLDTIRSGMGVLLLILRRCKNSPTEVNGLDMKIVYERWLAVSRAFKKALDVMK